jgi:hypothetical protein
MRQAAEALDAMGIWIPPQDAVRVLIERGNPTNGERAHQICSLGVDVPANTEAEEPTVLKEGNQETVNRHSRVTVLG